MTTPLMTMTLSYEGGWGGGGGHGTLRYCGIGLFSCGISVISILTYVIAVSSSSAVYGFSSFWLTVFGEIRLFTVS